MKKLIFQLLPRKLKFFSIFPDRRSHSKEPKSVTAFDLFTFFRTDLVQSEASWKLSSASDWSMSCMKECIYFLEDKSISALRVFLSCSHLTFSLVKRSSLTNFNIVLTEINKVAGYSVIVYKVVIKENTLVYSGGGEAKRWMLK